MAYILVISILVATFLFLLGGVAVLETIFRIKVRYPAVRVLVIALAVGLTAGLFILDSIGVPTTIGAGLGVIVGIASCVALLKKAYDLRLREVIGLFLGLIVSFVIVFGVIFLLVTTFVMTRVEISGNSMVPFISDGDRAYVQKLAVNYSRGDVVLIQEKYGAERLLVSRIAAIPGDTLVVTGTEIKINGTLQSASMQNVAYLSQYGSNTVLTKDTYFLISDNYGRAVDSRTFGPVPNDGYSLIGKIVFKSK